MPDRSWALAQTCENQLFVHWAVPAEALRPLVPEGLELDAFEGHTYLGLTVFGVTGVRLRGALPAPLVSSFMQLNVRTYVVAEDRPGTWFLSLDASSPLAVEVARRVYGLPFFRASITPIPEDGWTSLACARTGEDRPAVFEARFRAKGRATRPRPGTLEHFLTERYALYVSGRKGELLRADIHHRPWALQQAEVEIDLNTITPEGVVPAGSQPLAHFSTSQDFLLWPPQAVTASSSS